MTRRRKWLIVAAVVAIACVGSAPALLPRQGSVPKKAVSQVATATVERGDLSQVLAASGTLTFRARPDGTPYVALNQANGTYTKLPQEGDTMACGDTFYRVDDRPVLLLCGPTPLYRDLTVGVSGPDVQELNQNLHALGYDKSAGVQIRPDDDSFSWKTQLALERLQSNRGQSATGALTRADAVVMPSAIRVSRVAAQLGGAAQAGTPVAQGTSDTQVVQVSLDPSQQSQVPADSPLLVTLPSNATVTGKVTQVGRVAAAPAGSQGGADVATMLVTVALDDAGRVRGLDQAPVRVQITTAGVKNALNVPVVALVGKTGGGYAVDVVRADGSRHLVAVTLGLFDDATGRVQVAGDLAPGDSVVVPS